MISSQTLRRGLLTLGLAVVAAPAFASISTDYDHHADFRSLKTFSFYKVQTSNPLDVQRVKNEVARDLTKAGMEQVPSGGDVTITAIEDVHNEKEYNTFYDGLGDGGFGWGGWGGYGGFGGWGGDGGSSQTSVQRVPVGTLMLDMYDNKTHQLVWRGRSTSELSNKEQKNTKHLDKDIDHMLNGFPPSTKKG